MTDPIRSDLIRSDPSLPVTTQVFVLLTLNGSATGRIPRRAVMVGAVLNVAREAAEDYHDVFLELSRWARARGRPSDRLGSDQIVTDRIGSDRIGSDRTNGVS